MNKDQLEIFLLQQEKMFCDKRWPEIKELQRKNKINQANKLVIKLEHEYMVPMYQIRKNYHPFPYRPTQWHKDA